MQQILRSTQEEATISRGMAEDSRRLAEEMKQDSVAMKTVSEMIIQSFYSLAAKRLQDSHSHHVFLAWRFIRGK